MVKKIAILIMLVLITTQLIIVVSADVTDGTIPHTLPNYITGTYGYYQTGVEDRYFARAYTTSTMGIRIPKNLEITHVPYISRLYTGLETGKLYKWQYTFSDNIVTGVGDIAPTNNSYISIVTPANLNGMNLDPYIDQPLSFATPEKPYYIAGYTYSIPADNYRMFYDSNNKTLTCIMILPDNYFDGMEALQMHCYIMVALGQVTYQAAENFTVTATDSVPLHVQGDYTSILGQISDKLDKLSGSGLTEAAINEAIQDALTDYEEQLEVKTQNKLEQLLNEIDSYTRPYKEGSELIKEALHGFSDVFTSSSTRSVFTFPAGVMPDGTVLWEEYPINIGAAWLNIPAPLRSLISVLATVAILYKCFDEAVYIIKFIIAGERMRDG